jgi:signal transduction histidine kinase/ActR/RegA family two-component response regulator
MSEGKNEPAVEALPGDGRTAAPTRATDERARADEQLHRSHDTFYNLIQNNPFGVYLVDADFRLAQVSRGAQKVFANIRPLLGRDFAEVLRLIWAEPFASEAIGLFRHTLDTGEPYASPSTIEQREDTAEVEAYDWRIERITLPDGRFGVVCYFYDLSERQRWDAALHASEARRSAALAIAHLGTFEWDLRTDAVTLDDRSREIFGLGPGEGTRAEEVFARIDQDDVRRVFPEVQAARRDLSRLEIEYRVILPGGAVRHVVSISDAVAGSGGEAERMMGVFADVTDQRRHAVVREELLAAEQAARAEAERQSRIKDEFLATLSHELRTPLNAILGWSQVLRSGQLKGAEDMSRGLEIIERNARAQTRIIDDLLDMSRIISGKVRLDVIPLDLASVIEAAVGTVRHAADAKGVRLEVALDPGAGQVSGDPARLQQVFWNFLSNSVKHSKRGSRVRVVLERVDAHVEVSVTDEGEGISPEFLPHVFDRFRQADSTTTRRHGGLGLGLSIVKQLVELHGGTIRATSPGPGQGSTFTVALPLTPVHQEPDPAGDAVVARADASADVALDAGVKLAGVRVLVVDDEPDARALVKRLLEAREARVTTAASAPEALEAVRRERPDVVVSDIGMPGEDGYSFIRKVRALGPEEGGDVPAVALTAYVRSEERARALKAGFQMHLPKPVEPAAVVVTVARLARRTGRQTVS